MNATIEQHEMSQLDWGIDIQELFHIILEKFWLIVLSLLTFLALGLLYITISPRIYRATAIVQVEQAEKKIVKIEDVSPEDLKDMEILKTMEQNFLRRSLILRVVKDLNLKERKEFAQIARKAQEKNTDVEIQIADILLKKGIGIGLRRGTRLIDVSVSLKDPQLAADLANTIVNEFMQETVEMRYSNSQSAFRFLIEEADQLKAKLSSSELALQGYQNVMQLKTRIIEQEKLIDFLGQQYLAKHPKMIQARNLLKELQTNFLQEMRKIPSSDSSDANSSAESISTEDKFKEVLRRAESRFNVLTRDVQTDRILYESVLQRLKETDVTRGLTSVSIRVVESAFVPEKPIKPRVSLTLLLSVLGGIIFGIALTFLLNAFDSSLKTIDATEKYLDLPVLATVPIVKEDEIFKNDPSTPQGLYWRFHKLLRSFSFFKNKAYGAENLTIKNSLRDFLYSIKENIISSLHIPRNQTFKANPRYPLPLIQSPGCSASEAIRTLRVNLSLLGKASDLYSFLFTSSLPFEGKSFTAANFAIALAQQNYKTLLIDADLRRPTLHNYFNKPVDDGLTDCLLDRKSLEEVLKPTIQPNLRLLTAGTHCPKPAELLGTNDFSKLLEKAKKSFDRVVIDSAPINAVGDTLLLVSKVQHVCIIIQALKTPRHPIKRACMQLEIAKAHLVGVILNRIPDPTSFGRASYYNYNTSDGYRDVYSQPYAQTSQKKS